MHRRSIGLGAADVSVEGALAELERALPPVASAARRADAQIVDWLARHSVLFLRVSLGIVFFWFGALKFFAGVSPAEQLATRTLQILTFGLVPASVSIVLLAVWECFIGLGLILGVALRATLVLLVLQMLGTLTPILFFPNEVFAGICLVPTFEGQYIIKNIVLISGGLVVGATVRGGGLVADPEHLERAAHSESEERPAPR
jgi:uncharacterized membrane protein YphA (DoxX/SURF4 family)